jgi:O-acetyl-ADP-ribose deacetylase
MKKMKAFLLMLLFLITTIILYPMQQSDLMKFNIMFTNPNQGLERDDGHANYLDSCYFNSSIQCLSQIKPLTEYILNKTPKEGWEKIGPKNLFWNYAALLQKFLFQKENKKNKCIYLKENLLNTKNKFLDFFKNTAEQLFNKWDEQQDASEFLGSFIDSLEKFDKKIQKITNDFLKWSEETTIKYNCICKHGTSSTSFNGKIQISIKDFKTLETFSSLEECFTNYFEDEYLSGLKCEKCKSTVDGTKKMCITMLPKYLIIELKRFDFDHTNIENIKLLDPVTFKLKFEIDEKLLKFTLKKDLRTYRLKAFISHIGTLPIVGHYVAYVNYNNDKMTDDTWYKFNDIEVTNLKNKDIKAMVEDFGIGDGDETPYIIFYEHTKPEELETYYDEKQYKQQEKKQNFISPKSHQYDQQAQQKLPPQAKNQTTQSSTTKDNLIKKAIKKLSKALKLLKERLSTKSIDKKISQTDNEKEQGAILHNNEKQDINKIQQQNLSQKNSDQQVTDYQFKITIVQQNITKTFTGIKNSAIVNAANPTLVGGSGIAGAIFDAAGTSNLSKKIKSYFDKNIFNCGIDLDKNEKKFYKKFYDGWSPIRIKVGQAIITDGCQLNPQKIIHTLGPKGEIKTQKELTKNTNEYYSQGRDILLKNCYQNSLTVADENNITAIAFPLISSGFYSYPTKESCPVAIQAVYDYFDNKPNSIIKEIRFLIFPSDQDKYTQYKTNVEKIFKEKIIQKEEFDKYAENNKMTYLIKYPTKND